MGTFELNVDISTLLQIPQNNNFATLCNVDILVALKNEYIFN